MVDLKRVACSVLREPGFVATGNLSWGVVVRKMETGRMPVLPEEAFQVLEHGCGGDFGEAMIGAAADEGTPDAFTIFGDQNPAPGPGGVPSLVQARAEDGDGFDPEAGGEMHRAGVVGNGGIGGFNGGQKLRQSELWENFCARHKCFEFPSHLLFER